MAKYRLLSVLYLAFFSLQINAQSQSTELSGEYLGNEKPGLTPQVFASSFISTEAPEISALFHPNGKEFYYTVVNEESQDLQIMFTRSINGKWSKPEPLLPGDAMVPAITRDGQSLIYSSIDLTNDQDIKKEPNLWVMKRKGDEWSEAQPLSLEVNTPDGGEWFPSIGEDGTLYFKKTDFMEGTEKIYYSKFEKGKYLKPILFEAEFNIKNNIEDPYVSPDGSWVIFSPGGPELFGPMHISFRNDEGKWTPPKNMGLQGALPSLSPDQKYLFFIKKEDVYWVDAAVIEGLR